MERRIKCRLSKATFPVIIIVKELDFGFQQELDEMAYKELFNFEFVRNGENVIFVGPKGIGKLYLVIILGVKTSQYKIETLFIQLFNLVKELKIVKISGTLYSYIDKLKQAVSVYQRCTGIYVSMP